MLKRLFSIGLPDSDRELIKRVILTNKITLLLAFISTLYIPFFWLLGKHILSLYLIPLELGFLSVLALNYFKHWNLARLWMFVLANAVAFCYACLLGKEAGAQLLFFGYISIATVLFSSNSNSEKRLFFSCLILPIASYLTLVITDYGVIPFDGFAPQTTRLIHGTASVAVFIIIFQSIRFFLNVNIEVAKHLKYSQVLNEGMSKDISFFHLVGNVSHEISNLFSILILKSNMMVHRVVNKKYNEKDVWIFAKETVDYIQRMRRLTDAILTQKNLNMDAFKTTFNPKHLTVQIAHLMTVRCKDGKVFEFDIPQNCPSVFASQDMFFQALVNLSVNAYQHTPQGGTIRLTMKPATYKTKDGLIQPGVKISIQNTGKPIPNDVLPHIFDRFYTTKKTGKNAGLGLSFVKQFVDENDGHIEVDSGVFDTTTFDLYLPVAKG